MSEIKKFWVVQNVPDSWDLFTDPSYQDDNHRLLHFCGALDEGGYSLHHMIRIYNGTGQDRWEKENTKVYDNEAEARKDAEARFKKARARFEKQQKAASDPLVAKVAARFTAGAKPIETFTNEEDQMESYVFESTSSKGGYNVTMRDLDSGEMVSTKFTDIPDLKQAVAKAKKIVGK